MEISECTFVDGFRDFLRIDANATVSAIKFSKNTLCNVSNTNANKGIFYVRSAFDTFEFSDNLIMHASNAEKSILACNSIPNKISNNWFYKLSPVFWMPEEIDGKKVNETGKGKLAQSAGLAGGGQILSSDPCYDSTDGNLYVKNAAVLEAKVGDPRWLQAYKEVAEDLTLSPVAAGKSWNLMDTKTFGKTVKKSMVRDGLRFIVGANPFKVSEKGLEFAAAGTVEALGVPSDAAVAFMINSPGTVILSSIKSNTGSAQGHITVAYGPADGSKATAAGSVNIGMSKAKVSLPNVVPSEPQIVYLYGCSSVILTALQWTDQVDEGGSAVLAAPAVSISNESVQDTFTGEVKLSWDAVPAAGSYKVYVNLPADAEELPDAYAETSATEYVLPLSKLGTGKFTFQVQACPAADDMSREPSELSGALAFKYLETLKPVLVETVWSHDYFKPLMEELGTGDITSSTNGYSDDAMILGNLSYIFGGGKFKFGENEIKLTADATEKVKVVRTQLGGTGTPGSKACIQFKVAGPGTLVVEAIASGDETSTPRVLAAALNSEEKGTKSLSLKRTETPEILTVDMSDAKEGDFINIYSKNKGINVFSIKWVPSQVNPAKEYKMTLSATAGVFSSNITGLPTSWKATDTSWTAKDDSGQDEVTFSGNVYYSTAADKNIVWYFNKGKDETHVTATGLGTVKKIIIYPNSTRDPAYLTCTYNGNTLNAIEPVGTKSSTITYDFAAGGIVSDTFRIDYNAKDTNVEVGKVEIIYEK